jgi:hypothetical protein
VAIDFFEELSALVAELEAAAVPYAVAGAVALAVHGVPRATADIDLLVPAESVEAALAVARRRGFTVAAAPMSFSDGTELHRVTMLSGEDALTLDLLVVGEPLRPIWASRQRIASERGPLVVLSRRGLIEMKARSGREQDLADIRRLEELDR